MKKAAARSVKTAGPTGAAAEHLMFSLIAAAHSVEQRVEAAMEEVGLSSAKFSALTHLVHAGEALSLSECAKLMTCVRSNITQLMDRLEAEGLVKRVDDPNDRRGVRASVTPLGVERQAAGAKQLGGVQRECAKSLAGADRDALSRVLAAMR